MLEGKPLSYRNSNMIGWAGDEQSAYGDELIERIKDPNGSGLEAVTCAVPSPFARLERVKTAFENISKTSDLKAIPRGQVRDVLATQEDAKLVSQALDLAEMVFQRSIIEDLEFVHWNFADAKQRLTSGGNAAKRFADTLEIYLNQDQQFNTGDYPIRDFYLLVFRRQVIGSTSPSTLFAPADIDLSFCNLSLQGDRRLFTDPMPLYQRDADFQRYLYWLIYGNSRLRNLSTTFKNYLNRNLEKLKELNYDVYNEIDKLINDNNALEDQAQLYENNQNALNIDKFKTITIANTELPMKSEHRSADVAGSGFLLNSTLLDSAKPVLVLPPRKPLIDYQNIKYIRDYWDKSIDVPYADSEKSIYKRTLPGTNITAAYLTVSDLLEPNLICLPYYTNEASFFFGDIEGEGIKVGFLMPLKPFFFEFFSVKDLIEGSKPLQNNRFNTSKPRIRFSKVSQGINVELFLPIQNGNQVRFQRTYNASDDMADEDVNFGHIHNLKFNLAIYPKFRLEDRNVTSLYKVQCIVDGKEPKFDVDFFSNDEIQKLEVKRRTTRMDVNYIVSRHFTIEKNFDYIQITDLTTLPPTKGVVIPNWKPLVQGNKEFNFAVDFGTTNTHIEYNSSDMGMSQPFDITRQDMQLATLLPYTEDGLDITLVPLHDTVLKEFLPPYIGDGSQYAFPQSTVIAYNDVDTDRELLQALNDVNIPFVYNKKALMGYGITTDLKWQRDNGILAKLYFTEIMLLIRNKILLNGGNLSKSKLATFYPSSMASSGFRLLDSAWQELFRKYISTNPESFKFLPESIAPFYYYSKREGTAGTSICIDIGGGTTDVVIFTKIDGIDQPIATTSFRFAANSIFGDGYATTRPPLEHPLVKKYYSFYINRLANIDEDLHDVLQSQYNPEHTGNSRTSAEINAFLFSIENRANTERQEYHYSSQLRQDRQFHIVFIYFYSAIIYHIAQWLKHLKLDVDFDTPKASHPTNFFFSGTGSKILNIIDSSRSFTTIAEYTQFLIGKVFDEEYQRINIRFDTDNAKEVTAKGGLELMSSANAAISFRQIQKLNQVYTIPELVGESIKYGEFGKQEYKKIAQQVKLFNQFFIDALEADNSSFAEEFGIDSQTLELFEAATNKVNLVDYVEEGLTELNSDYSDKEKTLNNSPFFYPLINIIQELMAELGKNNVNQS